MKYILFVLCLLTPTLTLAANTIGTVEAMNGSAKIYTSGMPSKGLKIADIVHKDQIIETAARSKVRLKLEDGSSITLGQNARIKLNDLAPERPTKDHLLFQMMRGAFLYISGESAVKGGKIKTPFATIGIRGTTVWGGKLDKLYEVFLQDGEVEIINYGGSVTLKPGEGSKIGNPLTTPSLPVTWQKAKIERALKTITLKN